MGIAFRHSAGFGKRMEYNIIGQMLMEGLDVYLNGEAVWSRLIIILCSLSGFSCVVGCTSYVI